MTKQPEHPHRNAAELLADAPEPLFLADARQQIRSSNFSSGRRIAVLDDDPTGSQTVHDVGVVTVLDPAEYAAALAEPGSTCFILTNSRSLDEDAAVEIATDAGRALLGLDFPVSIVSRSDSTMRGHLLAEVGALVAARRAVAGSAYDGVLLVPAYFEAGRFTAGDVQWARVGERTLPVGATEFARDATFGYRCSDLREHLAEKSAGAIDVGDVRSLSLSDIRLGGPERVTEVLTGCTEGRFVVVNATDYADLEVVVLGLQAAEATGKSFLHRTGPSFVQALAGLQPQGPLMSEQLWPAGPPTGHGLVVVGSHVGLTSRQLAVATARGGLVDIELPVDELSEPASRDALVRSVIDRVVTGLQDSDVLLRTSRVRRVGDDSGQSLAIARTVSRAVTDVVRAARESRPAWVLAKGGITSYDVAVHGLGIRRATVQGQLFPGQVSVFRPVDVAPEVQDIPYVVFAGNVGDEETLADALDILRGAPRG